MTNPSKRKGTSAESAVVTWLRQSGRTWIERRALAGAKDQGDVAGWPGIVIEVKAAKAHDLAGWVRELEVEIVNAAAETGVVIAKKKGTTNVDDWYAILPARRWLQLMDEAGR
jgi:Holliday junction resolvase